MKTRVAIIGSGNIGTDLMFKIMRLSDTLEMAMLVGIDPESDGLRRADSMGIATTAAGVDGLIASPLFADIEVVFDATSAAAHHEHSAKLLAHGKRVVDLTPAAIGPYVVPAVNLTQHLSEPNVNMVTCGGQATIPIVHAVSEVVPVHYAEIVASISSRSAGPGTRANIDEFTETTAAALAHVGGAARGKAIIVLNPAEPPLIMRDTVLLVVPRVTAAQEARISQAIIGRVAEVAEYVPGYCLKQPPQFTHEGRELDVLVPEADADGAYTRVAVYLEVEGAGMYLPSYAGNLDIMTSAAMRTAERIAVASGRSAAA